MIKKINIKKIYKEFFNFLLNTIFPKRKNEIIIDNLTLNELCNLAKSEKNLEKINSLFSYKDEKVKALIWEIKYRKNSKAVFLVAKILAENIIDEMNEKMLFEKNIETILTGVPISKERLKERGFSQNDLLCKEILKNLNENFNLKIKYEPKALIKIIDTPKQSRSHNKKERLENLQNSFLVDKKITKDKRVILIDDVSTTGATIFEVEKSLKKAGVKEIITFTIAH